MENFEAIKAHLISMASVSNELTNVIKEGDAGKERQNQERINNLSYILANLQGKAKNAEQEKESTITAMGLLVEDSNNKPNTTFKDNNDKTSKQSRAHDSVDATGQTGEVINPNMQVSNRFSSLTIEESNEDDGNATQDDQQHQNISNSP